MSQSETNSTTVLVAGEIDRFDDVLHAQADDTDEIIDPDMDFDAFFTDFDKNEDEPEIVVSTIQKRPALTPTAPPLPPLKKQKPQQSEGDDEAESLPKYLSHTNPFFEQNIIPLLPQDPKISTDLLIEELRQLAYLEHQLQIANLDIELWTVYLQSGTGKLNVGLGTGESEVDQRSLLQQLQYPLPTPPNVWPDKLKSIIMDDPDVLAGDKANLSNSTCLNYVNQMLARFRAETLSYQTQIEQKRQLLQTDLTDQIEQKIIKLVDEYGTALYAIVNEGFIAAVRFTFKERIIELEFERKDTMHLCTRAFQTVVKSRTATERAAAEVKMLKARVVHQQIAPVLGSFQIVPPQDLQTIQDETLRQCLTYRYEQLLQRTKSELMLMHIRTAEIKANEVLKQFDNDHKQFFQKLRESYSESSLKTNLTNIMGQRFDLIEQRFQTLLDLKIRFFVKAPTVNKF